jgi:hypothetical protein
VDGVASVDTLQIFGVVTLPGQEQVDPIVEGKRAADRHSIRQHVAQVSARHVAPSVEATDRALRACVGQLRNESGLLPTLSHAYEFFIAEAHEAAGDLNVACGRSLQDAPEEKKLSIDALASLLVKTSYVVFRLRHLLDDLHFMPDVLLKTPIEVMEAEAITERLKSELRDMTYVSGLDGMKRLAPLLNSLTVPANAPRIVPARYGRNPNKQRHTEGLFIENQGSPARSVAAVPIRLGTQNVTFQGAEVPHMKREDGERFLEAAVETAPNAFSLSVLTPFRKWQQQLDDHSRETVGTITYGDFEGRRYVTYYRLGIDVLNADTGMVVEFLAQRLI